MKLKNKYIELIQGLINLKDEEKRKLNELNLEILYYISEIENISDEEKRLLTEEVDLNSLKDQKESFKKDLKELLLKDLKVCGIFGFVIALCVFYVLDFSLPTIGVSVLFTFIISILGINHDRDVKSLFAFNRKNNLADIDSKLSLNHEKGEKLAKKKDACKETLHNLKDTRAKRTTFIADLTSTINMVSAEFDKIIESILTDQSFTIDRDFMTEIKPNILERLMKERNNIEPRSE